MLGVVCLCCVLCVVCVCVCVCVACVASVACVVCCYVMYCVVIIVVVVLLVASAFASVRWLLCGEKMRVKKTTSVIVHTLPAGNLSHYGFN